MGAGGAGAPLMKPKPLHRMNSQERPPSSSGNKPIQKSYQPLNPAIRPPTQGQ